MRFEVENGKGTLIDRSGNSVSWIVYEILENQIHLIETHTATDFQGKGFAGKAVEEMIKHSEDRFEKIMVSCPYIKHWISKNRYESKKVEFTELLKLKESIDFFNRYHEPEAKAEYLDYASNSVRVRFSGYMCRTCGVYDYFEDIIQDVDAEVVDYQEADDESFIVTYRLKKL